MGKKPAAKKKGKALDNRGFSTVSVASKKEVEEEQQEEGEEQEAAAASEAATAAAAPCGDAKAPAPTEAAEEDGLEDWERLNDAGVVEAPAAAARDPSPTAQVPDFDGEEWERAVERRFDDELLKLERKVNNPEALAQFERKTGAAPGGVVVLSKQAEQKLHAALAPRRDEEGQLQMTYPRHWRYKGKLTYERLAGIYTALELLGFKGEQVRWAMEQTLGYDQRAPFELLLVNLPKEELPRQFGGEGVGDVEAAAAAAEKPDAPSPVAEPARAEPARAKPAGPPESAPAEAARAEPAGVEDEEVLAKSLLAAPRIVEAKRVESTDDADLNKRFALQYCEDSGSDFDDSQLLTAEEKLDRERRADPTAYYIKISNENASLMQVCKNLKDKQRSGGPKKNVNADQQRQREANAKMTKLRAEMEELDKGKYGKLDRAKIAAAVAEQKARAAAAEQRRQAQKEKDAGKGGDNGKVPAPEGASAARSQDPTGGASPASPSADAENEGDGEALPSLFDGEADSLVVVATEASITVREYNIAGWGGRTPRQNLEEYLRKRLWGKNAPKDVTAYSKVPGSAPGRYRARVTVHLPRGAGSKTFDPEEPCSTVRDADNLAAAWALMKLLDESDRDGYRRNMPPEFRNRWREWVEEAAVRLREAQKDFVRKKIEFLERLVRTPVPPAKPAAAPAGAGPRMPTDWGDDSCVLRETSGAAAARLREDFRRRRAALEGNREFQDIQNARENLPVGEWRDATIRAVRGSNVLIVSGATGSGKTTQVPQFILEDALLNESDAAALPNIIVTEPRRISAVSVAKRVSQELGDPSGGPGSKNALVGYQIRMEKKVTDSTRLLFCTVGVLLKQLQSGVAAMSRVTHIFIDEVHERSADCDLLILLLRQILRQHRPDLKVILMSATLEVDKLSRYFGGNVPVLSVPGRTFPVETYWVEDVIAMSGYWCDGESEFAKRDWNKRWTTTQKFEVSGQGGKKESLSAYVDEEDEWANDDVAEQCDAARYDASVCKALGVMDHSRINYDLVEEALQLIEDNPKFNCIPRDEGAVLIFLPGMMEITKVSERLMRHPVFGDQTLALVLSLHSVLSGEDHAKAFERPKRGQRKVVLSTNIAETGVTIPDVVFVIDAGKVKCQRYHEPTNTSSLKEQFVSRAEVLQRRGRAGRVREGFAFHLFTAARFDRRLHDMPTPEILRCSLMELMLSVLSSGLQPSCFLDALDPPPKARIDQAVATLRATGAVEDGPRPANAPRWGAEEDVWFTPTPVGLCLSRLPCDLRLGKMALYGALFGGNDAAMTVAATLSYRSPLVTPFSDAKRELAKSIHCAELLPKDGPPSDHFALSNAYNLWEASRKNHRSADALCRKSFLNAQAMQTIRELRNDLIDSLRSDGFCESFPKEELSRQDIQSSQVTSALFFAGLYPNVARVDPPQKASDKHPVIAAGSEHLKLHPGSLCHGRTEGLHRSNHRWVCYHTKMKTSQVFLRDCTFLTPNALLLFGGDPGSIALHPGEKAVSLGGGSEKHWHCLFLNPRVAALIRQLRFAFESMLRRKALDPKQPLGADDRAVVAAYVSIIGSVDTEG